MWTVSQNILNQDSSLYLQDIKSNHNTGRFEALFCWLCQQSPTFFATGTGFVEDNFSTDQVGRWSEDVSSALHLLCALFLVLLHQVHFRSSGIGSQSMGTPGMFLIDTWALFLESKKYVDADYSIQLVKHKGWLHVRGLFFPPSCHPFPPAYTVKIDQRYKHKGNPTSKTREDQQQTWWYVSQW